jgi:hypothetical protein
MNEREIDEALDARLARMPREIEPRRDLWPAIAARLQEKDEAESTPQRPRATYAWWQLGAAVLLVGLSSVTTYFVTVSRQTAVARVATVEFVQHELGASAYLPVGYVQARQELTAAFDESVARLSPATRQVVETNLREIERSLKEIGAALARDPGNATLQQLLVAASSQELQYLDEVRRLALNVPSKGA